MKKIISLILVAILVFSVTACNSSKSEEDTTTTTNIVEGSTIPLDVEILKYNWTAGVLVFENGKEIGVPCTVSEFEEASSLAINNKEVLGNITLKSGATRDIYLVGADTYISVKCKNTTDEDLGLLDCTIIGYSINNTREGNRNIKYVKTLSPGVGRSAVAEALGEPDVENEKYNYIVYEGRNKQSERVELTIGFNSENVVNSVSFEVEL